MQVIQNDANVLGGFLDEQNLHAFRHSLQDACELII
jgi:hypothetical protein